MKDNNIVSLKTPIENPLEALLKKGASDLLTAALEAEIGLLLGSYSHLTVAGKQAVVRNGRSTGQALGRTIFVFATSENCRKHILGKSGQVRYVCIGKHQGLNAACRQLSRVFYPGFEEKAVLHLCSCRCPFV